MKRTILSVILFGLINGFSINAFATSDSDFVDKNTQIETVKKDNGIVKTEQTKIVEEGRIVSIELKNDGLSKLPNYELEIIFNAIVKSLEKEFKKQNDSKVEGLFKNVTVSSNFNGTKNVSFEVALFEDFKEGLNRFIDNIFKLDNFDESKNKLKEIVAKNYDSKDIDSVVEKCTQEIEDKIEKQNNKIDLFNFSGFFNIGFDFFNDDDITKKVKQNLIEELNGVKNKIQGYKNTLKKEDLQNAINSIDRFNSKGEFKKQEFSVSRVATN